MKNRFFTYLLTVVCFFSAIQLGAQSIWTFDGDVPLVSDQSSKNVEMEFHSAKKHLELVHGITGNAIRTDGYSTWISTDIDEEVTSLSVYLAMESYPTDTATVAGWRNIKTGSSISISITKYGNVLLERGEDNVFTYVPTSAQNLERYKWYHFSLRNEKGHPTIYLDGKKVLAAEEALSSDAGNEVYIAKGFREFWVARFDATCVNCVFDNVLINCPLPAKAELASALKQTPVLDIPEIRFAGDLARPKYHVMPVANWTNESHGLIFFNGKYHIFNQKNASNITLRQMNWGHYTSPDLLHWTEQKIATAPDHEYDKNGNWSGCAFINGDGIPQIIYTAGADRYGVATAFPKDLSDPDLKDWVKYDGNPLVAEKPTQFTRTDMRDQYVWKESDGTWYMIIGFGIEGEHPHGTVLLYKSPDALKWEYVGLLYEGNPEYDQTGEFWEMPIFIKMDGKYVLMVNRTPLRGVPARTQYWVGDFIDEKFIPDDPMPRNLEVINGLLSPSNWQDKDNMVAMAIIPNSGGNSYNTGWAHLFSIPRIWERKGNRVVQRPHPVLKELREQHAAVTGELSDTLKVPISNAQMEIDATFEPNGATKFGLIILKDEKTGSYTSLTFDAERQMFSIENHTKAAPAVTNNLALQRTESRSNQQRTTPSPRPKEDVYEFDPSKPIRLHLFIDASVIEGFINEEDAFTATAIPKSISANNVEAFSNSSNCNVKIDVWKLGSAVVKGNF